MEGFASLDLSAGWSDCGSDAGSDEPEASRPNEPRMRDRVSPPQEHSSEEVYIAVMGMTGTGKSTFISHCTKETPEIGHALESCTQDVHVYPCHLFPDVNVFLIDTPGFDDSQRTDTQVLKEIANWMTKSFQSNKQLKGILYFHRISDTRMGGTQMRNLLLFKKTCGPDALKNVVLVTTMWDKTGTEDGERREAELMDREEHWGAMIGRGSRIARHYNSEASAKHIVAQFVPGYGVNPPEAQPLAIQKEMVYEHKQLNETDAGIELQKEFAEQARKLMIEMKEREKDHQEQMKLALENRDKEVLEFIHAEQQRSQAQLEEVKASSEALKVDMQRMHDDKLKEMQMELDKQKESSQRVESQLLSMAEKIGANQESHSKALQDWQKQKDEYDRRLKMLKQEVRFFEPLTGKDSGDNVDGKSDANEDSATVGVETFEKAERDYSRAKYRRFRRHFLNESAWRVMLGTRSETRNEGQFWNTQLNRRYLLVVLDTRKSERGLRWRGDKVRCHEIDGKHWLELYDPEKTLWVKYRCSETNERFNVKELFWKPGSMTQWERRVEKLGNGGYWYNKATGERSQLPPTVFTPGQWPSLEDEAYKNRVDKFRIFLDFLPL